MNLRDYAQDLDALLLSKPPSAKIEVTQMWQDHIGKPLMAPEQIHAMKDEEPDVEDAEDALPFIYLLYIYNTF